MRRSAADLRRAALALGLVLGLGAALAGGAAGAGQDFGEPREGRVRSWEASGVYQFIEVADAEGVFWVVAPLCGLREGDTLKVVGGRHYPELASSGLGRTFRDVYAAEVLELNGKRVEAFSAAELPPGCAVPPR